MSRLVARLKPPYLYCIADTSYGVESIPLMVELALAGGTKLFQLRGKGIATRELVNLGLTLKQLLLDAGKGNLLLVNDNPDACKEIGADGVHLGAGDMDPRDAREMLGNDAIIGVTLHNKEEALEIFTTVKETVDYVGIGPVFASPTKEDLLPLAAEDVQELIASVREHSNCPIICIGGIKYKNMQLLSSYKIDGVAVVSAIAKAGDPTAVCKNMLQELHSWR